MKTTTTNFVSFAAPDDVRAKQHTGDISTARMAETPENSFELHADVSKTSRYLFQFLIVMLLPTMMACSQTSSRGQAEKTASVIPIDIQEPTPAVQRSPFLGTIKWAQSVTAGSSNSYFTGVSVGSDGSVYATGYMIGTGTYNFGNSVTSTGTFTSGMNVVLVKYTSSGVAQWARTVTAGSSASLFYAVSVGSDGSVYAAGYISGTGTYSFGESVTAVGAYNGSNVVLGEIQQFRRVTVGSIRDLRK